MTTSTMNHNECSKRVVIFIKSLGGGAGKAATQYARILSDNDYNITLVVGRADAELSAKLPKDVALETLGMRGRMPPIFSLSRALRRIHPQAALVIGMGNGMPLKLALQLAGQTPTVIHREVNAPHALLAMHSRLRSVIELRMARVAYKRADHIICLTRAMYKELHEDWNLPDSKLNLIPNGVVLPDNNHIARELSNPPVIVCVSRLSAQKDISTLLRAFALLLDRRECRLKIAGDGIFRAKLEELAVKLGIASKVTFLGYVANPLPLYRTAHVSVLSSVFEGFPNTLIESLAQGCPVVATDCPTGPAEVVNSDEIGYLARMRNPEDLANQLERALQRNFDIAVLRARAENFSEDLLKCRVNNLFRKVFKELE